MNHFNSDSLTQCHQGCVNKIAIRFNDMARGIASSSYTFMLYMRAKFMGTLYRLRMQYTMFRFRGARLFAFIIQFR